MMLGEVGGAVDGYLSTARRSAPERLAAVYLVGGVALGDFSPRQSNVDLVVVGDPRFSPAERQELERAERPLRRGGRPAQVWYTTWEELAEGVPGGSGLDTPMTRAMLRNDAAAMYGPDWPVVAFDPDRYRRWCVDELQAVVGRSEGLMLLRRTVTSLVLQAARLAQGAVTGKVFSKSAAGESVGSLVPVHFRRILTDGVGYRRGAHTSMYWGPFERKYDARALLVRLLEVATREA
jgi:Nucleotidyltransferase domain